MDYPIIDEDTLAKRWRLALKPCNDGAKKVSAQLGILFLDLSGTTSMTY